MNSPWLSYIPHHVVEDMLNNPQVNPVARERRFDAVALFADVSGFTVISEALGKTGRAGTEELTMLLNSYFEPMIALIRSYGGIVGKFGGDAMTVLFAYETATQSETVRRAVQCALEMQVDMTRYEALQTSAGVFGLAMKAGLAMGSVLTTNVGQADIRLEYVIAGELLDLCADAEHHATKGEVVVHDALLAYIGDVEIIERRGGFTRIGNLHQPATKTALPPLPPLPESINTLLSSYLHPRIAELVGKGHSEFINEHRRVTILFVSFTGFDYDHDPEVGTKLKAYLGAVIATVHQYDGYVNKIDMGDKGSKYIILFGAPIAHENDDERALRCALDLKQIADDVPVRIGINTGFVYCGQVGSDIRREYTVMGDSVNLSARLMQYAQPGEIVVSGFTTHFQQDYFGFEERDSIMVKGKTQPIPIRVLKGITQTNPSEVPENPFRLPMVGRQQELTIAEEQINEAIKTHGRILGVTAEAGMGKSRLTSEIISIAKSYDLKIYIGECLSYGTNISYLVWQNVWRGIFGISPVMSEGEQIKQVEAALAQINPLLVLRMPLLGPVLNIAIPDNALTEELEPKLRQNLLSSLLLDCLRWHSQQTSILLVIEDSHWIDSLSQQLLEFIGRNIRDLPVMILMVYRPTIDDQTFNPIKQFPHFTELALKEFTPEETKQLVALKLRQLFRHSGMIVNSLMERITERAQGNPFYIDELINLIHERGINPDDTEALQKLELPDSLHSLIVSRIDYLAEQDKLTLKVASVIGRLFRVSWLWGSYPELGEPADLQAQLKRLYALEIVSEDNPEPELEYLFKHVLTQEVAYESLAYATREALHESVGDYIERAYAEALGGMVSILAHHYGRSRNNDKQRVYFRLAAEAAGKVYDNQSAITYYRRLLNLLPADEQMDTLLKLGEVLQLIGDWGEAETLYRQALALSQPGSIDHARSQTLLGNLMLFTQSPADAENWLENAKTTLEKIGEDHVLKQTLKFLAIVYWQQGKLDDALKTSLQQLEIAIRTQDGVATSEAHLNMANVYMDQGDFSTALDYFQRSLDTSIKIGYRYGVVTATSDEAALYFFQGDYAESLKRLQTALAVTQEIGFLQGAASIVTNMGEIYRQEQNYHEALLCYGYGLNLTNSLGDLMTSIHALANMATVYKMQQLYTYADQLYNHAINLARQLDIAPLLSEYLHHLADLRYQQGGYDEAAALNAEALGIAEEIGQRDTQLQAQIMMVRARLALKQITSVQAIEQLESYLDMWVEPPNQAALCYHIWQIAPHYQINHDKAIALYRELYISLPNVLHYQRLKQLTEDETLQPPAPLPQLPQSIRKGSLDVDAVLSIAEALR